MLRLNLKLKLIGLIAGLIVIVLAAAGILIIRQVEIAMDNETHKRVIAVAKDLARFSSSALISHDIASLHHYVKCTMEQDYVHHAIILDRHGKVIMHNNLSEVGKTYSNKLTRTATETKKIVLGEHYSTEEGDIIGNIFVPIEVGGTRLGTVIIGHSHAGIHKEIGVLKRQIGVMVLIAILVGMVFAIILATYISTPLKELRDAAVEIGKGERDITLEVKSRDEIGDLVDSFNKMATDLRKTTVSRDLLMKEVTDRKQAEEELRESEAQKQAILDAPVDAIALVDTRMRIVWANKTTAAIVNKTPEDLIGHRCHKLFQHSDAPCPGCPCKKALETGNIEHATMYQPAMDTVGESYWEDYGVPVKDESGQVVGVIEICRNVTDKVKAEKALRESEEKLVGIVESVTDAMIMVDEHFNIVWTNDIVKDLFEPELVGKKCYTAFHGRNKICEPCIVKKCFEDGRVHEFETEIVGANGKNQRTFWCTASVAAWQEDGRPKMVVEFLRNISERKRAEEELKKYRKHLEELVEERTAELKMVNEQLQQEITERKRAEGVLRESENKYRILLENLPQKIFFKDKNSVYISCNENYARDMNIKPDEVTGKTDYDFFPTELAEKYRADDKGITESGKTEDIEEEYIQDGQKVFVHTVKTPVKDENGNIVGILGVFWDITQRKRAEEALKKQDKEKIRFINALIHEIKTPLTAMLASSELLREELADSSLLFTLAADASLLSALAENLDIAARNLNRRVSELMDFAKLQSTEPLLRSQPVDIHQLAQQAAAQVTALLKNKGQILNLELPASLPQLEADPDRVVQTLLNLLTNASKFSPPNSEIYLRAYPADTQLILEVRDSAPPIGPKEAELVFKPYYLGKETGGCGLGLSICKRLVELHGGKIWVETQGKGNSFKFSLPLAGDSRLRAGDRT